ncbi:MAG: hypothetical protein ACPGVG_14975 [Mycobacterium sp.]
MSAELPSSSAAGPPVPAPGEESKSEDGLSACEESAPEDRLSAPCDELVLEEPLSESASAVPGAAAKAIPTPAATAPAWSQRSTGKLRASRLRPRPERR